MFELNEVVVYRNGMYRIEEIRMADSKESKTYVLVPYNDNDGSMKIMVPALNKMGYLRKPCTKEEINALISRIPDLPVINQKDHRSAENEYKNLLKQGSLDNLVRIIKTTYLRNMDRINQNKKLIAKDQIYFEEAEKLLYQEIGYVLNMDFNQTKEYICTKLKG